MLSTNGGSSKSRDSIKFRMDNSNGRESSNGRNASNSKYKSSETIGLSATAETCTITYRDPSNITRNPHDTQILISAGLQHQQN